MRSIGFDNEKYIKLQSQKIQERISNFGGKLYLEFGGKLFDDYHASRVLPGFCPDSKIKMLIELRDVAEIIITINTEDIEKNTLGTICSSSSGTMIPSSRIHPVMRLLSVITRTISAFL